MKDRDRSDRRKNVCVQRLVYTTANDRLWVDGNI